PRRDRWHRRRRGHGGSRPGHALRRLAIFHAARYRSSAARTRRPAALRASGRSENPRSAAAPRQSSACPGNGSRRCNVPVTLSRGAREGYFGLRGGADRGAFHVVADEGLVSREILLEIAAEIA